MDYGSDSYTTPSNVATYLDRTLDTNELAILDYVIPAVSRWIDRSLNSNFDHLDNTIPYGTAGSAWTQRKFGGGYREINITPCQQILNVQAVNPYDFSVWYTYSTPLEYVAEPNNLTVKKSLRLKMNEFTSTDIGLKWPGDEQGIMVTAIFSEYDYTANDYPSDIKLLANHICAIWLQNNQNAEPVQKEAVEGHSIMKRIDDLILSDPMITRIIESRQDVWLDEM